MFFETDHSDDSFSPSVSSPSKYLLDFQGGDSDATRASTVTVACACVCYDIMYVCVVDVIIAASCTEFRWSYNMAAVINLRLRRISST
jgi:hypothetical protein